MQRVRKPGGTNHRSPVGNCNITCRTWEWAPVRLMLRSGAALDPRTLSSSSLYSLISIGYFVSYCFTYSYPETQFCGLAPKSLTKSSYVTRTEGHERCTDWWKVRLVTVCGCQGILICFLMILSVSLPAILDSKMRKTNYPISRWRKHGHTNSCGWRLTH